MQGHGHRGVFSGLNRTLTVSRKERGFSPWRAEHQHSTPFDKPTDRRAKERSEHREDGGMFRSPGTHTIREGAREVRSNAAVTRYYETASISETHKTSTYWWNRLDVACVGARIGWCHTTPVRRQYLHQIQFSLFRESPSEHHYVSLLSHCAGWHSARISL